MLIVRYGIYPRRHIVGLITLELLLWLSLCVCLALWFAVEVATVSHSSWAYNLGLLLDWSGISAGLAGFYLLWVIVMGSYYIRTIRA
jgi:hypothetical protein